MINLITTKKLQWNPYYQISSNLEETIELLQKETILCLDTETTDINPLIGHIVILQLGTLKGDQYVIDVRDFKLSILKPLLENPNITFVGHNIKFDYNMLKRYKILLNKVYDTMIVDKILYNGKYSMGEIIKSKRFSLAGVYKYYFDIDIEKGIRSEFTTIRKKK